MEMQEVESTNIAAIGFEDGQLRVRFRSGKEFGYAVTEEQYRALMAADSKGRFLRKNIISKNVSRETSVCETPVRDILHSTQADGCCGVELNRAAYRGKLDTAKTFTCPKCDTEFKRNEFGPLVRWDCVADFAVV